MSRPPEQGSRGAGPWADWRELALGGLVVLFLFGAVYNAVAHVDPQRAVAWATVALALLTVASLAEGRIARREGRATRERHRRETLFAALAELRAAQTAYGFAGWTGFPVGLERDALRRCLAFGDDLDADLYRSLLRADSMLSGQQAQFYVQLFRRGVERSRGAEAGPGDANLEAPARPAASAAEAAERAVAQEALERIAEAIGALERDLGVKAPE